MAPNAEDYLQVAYQRAKEKKTHVSFPQLKYPSLRDEGPKDPVQWLTGKAMDDGAEGLWRVQDKLYDLTDFVKRHPGGSEWLVLTKGTDITEAFESHHLNPSVETLLDKFYVREAKTPRNSPFTFKDDGFYRTLKREVYEELKKIPPHIPKRADRIIDGLFASLLINSALACWATDPTVVWVTYLLAALSLCWVVIASHNYIHRKDNWRMYLFSLSLWSYRDFRISHALSHHPYPNTLIDLEISAFEPYVFWNPREDKPFYAKIGILFEVVAFPFVFMKNWLYKFSFNFTREGFYKDHYFWHECVGLTLPVWMWVVSGVSFYDAVIMWLWINTTASAMFFHIGSNAAHHHPKIFKDGDQVRTENPDWGVHELEAVMDRSDINSSLFTVMTFFGSHTMHHLFPTLDHAVLPYLYPVLLRNCEKFKAKFQLSNILDLFIGQIQSTIKSRPSLLEERDAK